MPSPRSASAFSSFTTIYSGVCFENFLTIIHSARPHTARTTQNNPLKTNGPKNPDPSMATKQISEISKELSALQARVNGSNGVIARLERAEEFLSKHETYSRSFRMIRRRARCG